VGFDSLTVLYLQQLWECQDKRCYGEVSNWVSSDYKLDLLTPVRFSRWQSYLTQCCNVNRTD